MIYKRTITFKTDTKSLKEFRQSLKFHLACLETDLRMDYFKKVFPEKLPGKLRMVLDKDREEIEKKIAIYDKEYEEAKCHS